MIETHQPERVILEVTAPAWSDKPPPATRGLFEALHSLQEQPASFFKRRLGLDSGQPSYSAEIVASRAGGIRFLWSVPAGQQHAVRRLLESYWPDFKIRRSQDYGWPEGNHLRLLSFSFSHDFKQSLRSPEYLADYDPLGYLTASLVKLREGEQITYQILGCPLPDGSQSSSLPLKALKGAASLSGKAAAAGIDLFQLNAAPTAGTAQAVEEPAKLQTPLFRASLRILISSSELSRLKEHAQTLKAAVSLFNNLSSQNLIAEELNKERDVEAFLDRRFGSRRKLIYLSPSELAGLYHFPDSRSSSFEAMPRFLSKSLPPTAKMLATTDHHVLLGDNLHQEELTLIGLSEEERQRHLYIVGGTGTGKTTLLKYMIVQDIKAGRGVAVVDPHGDLAADLLNYIPKRRAKDLIYFNPADYRRPVGINLLQLPEGLKGDKLEHAKDMRTEAMVSVLRKVFHSESEDIGHRIEYVLRNTIQTAFTVIDPTLFTIFKLLNDPKYNQQVTRAVQDPYLKLFWRNEIGRAGAFQKVKMQAGVTAKIGRFIFSTSVKKAFNQVSEDCLDFKDLIDKRKILICNFSKGLMGEDASQLFSTTVLAKLQLTALEQVAKKESRRRPFYLYVDEFQHFATQSFVEMLSEARKYGLNLTMSQQSAQQQGSRKLTEILLANVGTLVNFRTGSPADTDLFTPLYAPFLNRSDLANLSSHQFYIKKTALEAEPPTSGTTKLPEENFRKVKK